jgi:uncharacterized protein YkwD
MRFARARLAPAVLLLALIALFAFMLLAPKAHGAGACAQDRDTPRALRLELRCLINVERLERGLARLRANGALFRAAGRHARDMVRRRYFSHTSRSGGTPTSRVAGTGYLRTGDSWVVGENIAWEQRRRPRAVESSWMRSPGHRRVLLSPRFRELGIGVATSSPQGGRGMTAVVDFGRRTRG